jgi:hypothetical protein
MDDIIAMAREAGAEFAELPMGDAWVFSEEGQLQRFATLVRADERDRATRENAYVLAEREACAKVCDRMEQEAEGTECCKWPTPADCAHAIRARSDK